MAYNGDNADFQNDLIETQKEIIKLLKAAVLNLELMTENENTIDDIEE